MSPHLPITPEEIARDAIGAYEAGAAVLHLHARNPTDGRPSADASLFMQFLPKIKQSTNAILNITTGGGQGMSLEQRLEAALVAKPEMCSLNMGSLNFGIFPAAERYQDWKHAWEPEYLEGTRNGIFRNTFGDIERILSQLGEFGTRFEYECYDIGHLHTLAYFVKRGLARPPLFVQSVFGVLGGIAAEIPHLMHMRQTADSLFGDTYHWSVVAAGRHQMRLCTVAGLLGGNVRVGLEDSLFLGKGRLATSSAAQVSKIRNILETLDLEIATADEARELLGLKGANCVAF